MPILTDEYRQAMQASADERPEFENDGEFEELPDGFYLAQLEKVVPGTKKGPSGYIQVRLQWRIMAPGKWRKRVHSDFISLAPKAAWRMRELFDATGYTYDSDLEELLQAKEKVIIELVQREQERGDRKGEMVANLEAYYSAEDEYYRSLVGA